MYILYFDATAATAHYYTTDVAAATDTAAAADAAEYATTTAALSQLQSANGPGTSTLKVLDDIAHP